MRIHRSHTVAICVDVQERLFPHIFHHDALATNCVKLIKGLKLLEVPIYVTEQYTNGLGKTIPVVSEAIGEYEPHEKMSFSACGITTIQSVVLGGQGHQMILFGVETHVCILQTALDILDQGRTPIIVEDCVSSRKEHDKLVAIERLRTEGAVITTMESLLFELMESADADVFKQISQLVK